MTGSAGDEAAHLFRIELALTGDALRLVVGGGRADVWIQPAGRGRHQIDRHRPGVAGIGGAQGLGASFHGIGQSRIERPLVGAGGRRGVVRIWAGSRGAAPEILGLDEVLADQFGADGLHFLDDQAAIGGSGEGQLRDAGHRRRIEQAGDDGEQDEQRNGGTHECFSYGRCA
jgi:hypothetical protein